MASTVRDLRRFLPEFAVEVLAALDGRIFAEGGLTATRRAQIHEAWDWLGALTTSKPGGNEGRACQCSSYLERGS